MSSLAHLLNHQKANNGRTKSLFPKPKQMMNPLHLVLSPKTSPNSLLHHLLSPYSDYSKAKLPHSDILRAQLVIRSLTIPSSLL
jgi:hypothetical protein